MKKRRKVTIVLPEELLDKAQEVTGSGLTGTIVRGLELLASSAVYDKARQLRGKMRFSIDVATLREDR